jgi:hypothetical protein
MTISFARVKFRNRLWRINAGRRISGHPDHEFVEYFFAVPFFSGPPAAWAAFGIGALNR